MVRFAELRHETRVVAVAPAGIYVLSPLIGERFVASADRCFEVVEPIRPPRRSTEDGPSAVAADHEGQVLVEQ